MYHVIHQSYLRLLLFTWSWWETAKLFKKTYLSNLWKIFFPFLGVRWHSFHTSFCLFAQPPLLSSCFSGRSENKMAVSASVWLILVRHLVWNRSTEFNKTYQEPRFQCSLPNFCFLGRSVNKMAAQASDCLRHFRIIRWNRWTEFKETWQEARFQRFLPRLCFWAEQKKKQDGCTCLWLAETFSTFPLTILNGIQWNVIVYKISTFSIKFMFFGPIGNTRWAPWPLINWDIFDFSYETAEKNSSKLDRKQHLNVLYKVSVFRANQKTNMAASASDWLRHFRILRWNRWTEFNETWQEARFQRFLPRLCFWADQKKKTRCLHLPLIDLDNFEFSSDNTERHSMKRNSVQDLNVLYQVYVFRADRKYKMGTLASD